MKIDFIKFCFILVIFLEFFFLNLMFLVYEVEVNEIVFMVNVVINYNVFKLIFLFDFGDGIVI